jgi:hypothetical protein
MTNRLTPFLLAISIALACTSGGVGPLNGTATVNGLLNGHAFQAADAIAAYVVVPIGANPAAGSGSVTIASNLGLCQDASAYIEPKNTQYLLLAFTEMNPTSGQFTPPTAPGDFVVAGTGTRMAIASYTQTDASCHEIPGAAETAVSGTITVSSLNSGSYSGSFDLTLVGGAIAPADHVTGSFTAPNCPPGAVFFDRSRTTTCF